MKTLPLNFNYSNSKQKSAFNEGRRVFELDNGNISELIELNKDGGETWVYRGDISGTINGTEKALRRLYENCLVSRK